MGSSQASEVIVPGSNLKAQYLAIKSDIDDAIQRVLDSGEFDRGDELEELEAELARFCGVQYAVGVGSGYAAIFLALKACDIGPQDEVITVANTDMATVSAILHTGATPILVDVLPDTYNLDSVQVERAISPRTRAIVPVHLYGLPADMDPIMEIAEQHGLLVVEDAAIALGARYKGRPAGSIGDLGCVSFAPRKMLGAYGDGGLVTTHDRELADRVRLWAGYGEWRHYRQVGPVSLLEPRDHEVPGYHSHLVTLQAAILRAKLPHLKRWIARRQEIASRYGELLRGSAVIPPAVPPGLEHVYRNYVVRVQDRDAVRSQLAERGIHTDVLYAPPIHLQTVFRERGYRRGDLPVTEELAEELLALPMFAELSDTQVDYVAESLRETVS